MRRFGLLAAFGLVLSLSSAAWATPQLQLFLDPSLNPGAYYDTLDQDWVADSSNGPITVSAFMHGQLPGDTYQLVISTPSFDPIADGDPIPSIGSVSGATLGAASGWIFGTPSCCGGSLPGHDVFPDEHALYDFSFTGPTTTLFDVQKTTFNADGSIDTLVGAVTGYRADFVVDFGPGIHHLDLINKTATGVPNGKQKAPFSHDATIVPEPTGALVFALGSLLVGWRLRRRGR